MGAKSKSEARLRGLGPPRNGKYYTALLVGGPADRFREIKQQYRENTKVLLVEHWEYKGVTDFRKPVPKVDLIVILKDMIGHSEQHTVVAKAKAAGVRFIRTQHKWSTARSALANYRLVGSPTVDEIIQAEAAQTAERRRPQPTVTQPVTAPVAEPAAETTTPETIPDEEAPMEPTHEAGAASETETMEAIFDEWMPTDGQIMAAARLISKNMKKSGFNEVKILADGQIIFR